jgi:hypothetical protein
MSSNYFTQAHGDAQKTVGESFPRMGLDRPCGNHPVRTAIAVDQTIARPLNATVDAQNAHAG